MYILQIEKRSLLFQMNQYIVWATVQHKPQYIESYRFILKKMCVVTHSFLKWPRF